MTLRVSVVYAAPGIEAIVALDVPDGATVADAVERSGLVARASAPELLALAIHGQRARADTPLAEGDRVELTRPLVADPKAQRRRRARDHPLPKAGPAPKPRPQ